MRFPHSIAIILLCMANGTASADITKPRQQAPTASAEEAIIKHWRLPEIKRTFWDIKTLDTPFITAMPQQNEDGIPVGKMGVDGGDKAAMIKLASAIADNQHQQIDSLLIAQNGKLLFESYYLRGRIDLPHPQSSTTKSYTSLAIGRAIQLGYLSMADLDKPVVSFLKQLDHSKLVKGAETITLQQILSMRSGLAFSDEKLNEYGSDPTRYYGIKRVQAFFADSQPVTAQSQRFNYQGPNPDIAMQVLQAVVPGSAHDFIRHELFGKLGITNFDWRTEQDGSPSSGAFSSLTSRDMLKIGLLVMNKGNWQGEQLIPQSYISNATQRQLLLSDEQVKNFYSGANLSNSGYGYFWWQTDLALGNKRYSSISAQGGGGLTILLVAELDLVVVITGHSRQAYLQLIAENIVPAFSKH